MLVVGLTGGIASGKSTISKYLASHGAKIIDADKIARDIVEPGKEAWKKIKSSFGSAVFNEDQTLNRAKLGKIIFEYPEQRQVLNAIIHPEVIAETQRLIDTYKRDKTIPLIVVDAPLLIEAKMTPLVDEVWVINISKEKQIERVMERDNITKEEAEQRIASQMPTEEKIKYAHRLIDTNINKEETFKEVSKLWEEIVEKKHDKGKKS